jgi:hypothetical protein
MADPGAERDLHDVALPILTEAAAYLEWRGLSLRQIADEFRHAPRAGRLIRPRTRGGIRTGIQIQSVIEKGL